MIDPFRRGRLAALALGLSAALASAAPAGATVWRATTVLPSCAGGALKGCADTGVFSDVPADAHTRFIGSPLVDGAVATFATAFAAWNAAHGDAWRLVDGGALDDISIRTTIGVSASADTGGLSPVLFTLDGGSRAELRKLVWTQALVIDYTPLEGALPSPVQTLDTFDLSQNAAGDNPNFPASCAAASSGASPVGGAFCGPIYPFQYGATLASETLAGVRLGVDPFYDAPQGDWPGASFEAIALLSAVTAPDTLTVYQGVAYGFSLRATTSGVWSASRASLADPIPEPSTWALALAGFAALATLATRRRQAAWPL